MSNNQDCTFDNFGFDHICRICNTRQLPKILANFGAVSKAVQPLPKEDEMDKPYWASSHIYNANVDDWGKIEISVTEFEQSGLIHHFGVISLGIADAICKVPALPAATDSLEICRRTLEDDVTEQYQRPLEFERIENIERFLKTNPTIVNPVILEISESSLQNGSVAFVGDGFDKRLSIDLSKIQYINDNLVDVDFQNGIDYRPIDLVDGQHRIRSSRLSHDAMNMLIPFVIVDEKYEGGGGRIFAEINVQSNDLPKLHKLHLRYVLKLASHLPAEDFGFVPDDFMSDPESYDEKSKTVFYSRFANRMAYKIGARLALEPTSPLHDMLLFFGKGRTEVKKAIDAFDWVADCHPWVLQFEELAKSEEDFFRTVRNYFDAWRITANTDPKTGISYHDKEINNRWGKGTGNSEKSKTYSRLFNKVFFRSIMALFPLTYKLSEADNDTSDEEMIQAFIEVLKPCRPIDGLDLEAWETISDTNSRSKDQENHIYHWMSWAIYDYHRTGILVSPELAWNVENGEPTEVLSAPGQGFFSPINPEFFSGTIKVEGISGDFWEGLNQATITVSANEIPNEAIPKTISVTYIDRNGVERPERRTKHTVGPRPGIGFNFLSQLFQTSTKTHGVTAIEVTVTSGNLFSSGAIPIFKQRYSIDELRMMNNSGLVIGSSTFVGKSTVEDLYVERFEPEQDTETTQYIVKPGEGYSEPQEADKEDSEVDTVFNAPPPRNKSHQTWKEIDYRKKHMPIGSSYIEEEE